MWYKCVVKFMVTLKNCCIGTNKKNIYISLKQTIDVVVDIDTPNYDSGLW